MNIVIASILIAVLPLFTGAQTLHYTNNKISSDKYSPVVAGVFHDTLHIIEKDSKSGITIYIYNGHMELIGTKLLPGAGNKEQYDVLQVIKYTHFYFAIIGNRKTGRATALKIYPSGKFEDETQKLQTELKGLFPNYLSISKFEKVEDDFVLSIMYYDSAHQKAYLNVHQLDSTLKKEAEHTVELLYNPDENHIHEVIFPDLQNAYILKSYNSFSVKEGEVEIFHYNFVSDVATKVTIAEEGFGLINPTLHYSSQDSTLLFFSSVSNVSGRRVFAAANKYYRLGFSKVLEEISPPRLMQIKQIQNEKSIFIIDKVHDVSVNNINSLSRTPKVYYNNQPAFEIVSGYYDRIGTGGPTYQPTFAEASYKRTDVDLRILWTDQQTGIRNDTLLTTKKARLKAEYLNSFLFRSGGKYFIFYCINYSARGNTISYISTNNGAFSEEEFLPVNHRYEYMLPLARKINDRQLIIPYTYKGSTGFVKITMKR